MAHRPLPRVLNTETVLTAAAIAAVLIDYAIPYDSPAMTAGPARGRDHLRTVPLRSQLGTRRSGFLGTPDQIGSDE
jgi:hypothetical protein